jgi:RNA polymerase sigma factor (TIGR02999 family)
MPVDDEHEVTRLLELMVAGDADASDRLMSLVYTELRALAAAYMRKERDDHTLQPTALVNEAWIRLVSERVGTWKNRAHFYGIAAQAMRRVLLDHARGRRRLKRHGGDRVTLDDDLAAPGSGTLDVLAVDEALQKLETLDPRQARVVEARFFGGLDIEETAEALGVSTATVKRDWAFARAFLQRELDEQGAGKPDSRPDER